MRIAVGHKGDYAVRAAIDLARHHGERRKAREIAAAMDIPQKYLAQVLAPLVRQGLLVAVAGPDGGYALSREPAAITLLDVIEASEGSLGGGRCLLSGVPCNLENTCAVHDTWRRAQQAMTAELRRTSLADLVTQRTSTVRAIASRTVVGGLSHDGNQEHASPKQASA